MLGLWVIGYYGWTQSIIAVSKHNVGDLARTGWEEYCIWVILMQHKVDLALGDMKELPKETKF